MPSSGSRQALEMKVRINRPLFATHLTIFKVQTTPLEKNNLLRFAALLLRTAKLLYLYVPFPKRITTRADSFDRMKQHQTWMLKLMQSYRGQ
jgi:type II secretory pathway component PulM